MPYGRTLGEKKKKAPLGRAHDGAALGEEQQGNCPGQLHEGTGVTRDSTRLPEIPAFRGI